MDKKDVARLLEQIASFLELKGENAFRVRAYHTAARAVAQFPGDLHEAVASGELAELRGIGPATLSIVEETLRTGRAEVLEQLRVEVPPGLVEMMGISGLGVAKIRQIHESLGIDSLADLERAARDGRLAALPRFGAKTAEKILRGLEFLRQVHEFKLLHHARHEAASLAGALADLPGVATVEIAGSVRRRRELIRDLDFVVGLRGAQQEFGDRLANLGGLLEFSSPTAGTFTLRFSRDTVADVFVVRPDRLGFALVRATGSRDHLEQLEARAGGLGLGWEPSGLTRDGAPLPLPTEEAVYAALDLQFVPPELREGHGEIDAAERGSLPALVRPEDVKGFLHCHTNYSDGTNTVRDWADAARAAGYEYIGITDHSAAATYAGGLFGDAIAAQHAEIDAVNRAGDGVTVLKGVEVEILENGQLDYDTETRASFDFIIASVHNRFGQTAEQMTERILRAMDDPDMAILGHPTGRLLLARDPYPMNLDAILERAAERSVVVEINAHPQRLDLDWRVVRSLAGAGLDISIGADAHNTSGMSHMELGIGIARKGWLTADQILNTRPLAAFLERVERRRRSR